jgi:hypothetical protein
VELIDDATCWQETSWLDRCFYVPAKESAASKELWTTFQLNDPKVPKYLMGHSPNVEMI